MLAFDLTNGSRMVLDECDDMIEVTLYDENGIEINFVDWLADSVCEMLFNNEN